jgi:hypothetical protein
MGKSISVEVGGKCFLSKGELTTYIREMISRHAVGTFLDEENMGFCLALFMFHPEAAPKFGTGISQVEVRRDEYGNKHFQVHRSDGSNDDISWVQCVRSAR